MMTDTGERVTMMVVVVMISGMVPRTSHGLFPSLVTTTAGL